MIDANKRNMTKSLYTEMRLEDKHFNKLDGRQAREERGANS